MRKELLLHVSVVTPFKVLYRWATEEIPVKNKETGRIVYVLPETLDENPNRFKRPSPNEDPTRQEPDRAKRPRKPRQPDIPTTSPPAPIKPPEPPELKDVPEPTNPVPDIRYPRVPEPSPFKEWTTEKRFQANVDRIIQRFMK